MKLTHLCEEADNHEQAKEEELTPVHQMEVGYNPTDDEALQPPYYITHDHWKGGTWDFVCEVCGLRVTVDIG